MTYSLLCITDRSDLPETELFIGLARSGVDITVCCNPTGRHYHRLVKACVNTIELVIKSRFSVSAFRTISSILDRKPYDIVYCFNNKAAANALFATRNRDITVITYRGVDVNLSLVSPASLTTHLHPRVKKIICVCNAVRDYVNGLSFAGFTRREKRAVTIYKGHDLSWYNEKPADLSEFGISEKSFVVGFAGRNRAQKGFFDLVDAASLLPADAPIFFLLLGRLAENKKLVERIAQSPCARRIHLTGFRTDAPSIIAACDIFAAPSIGREGLAKTVIEAMAHGVPPVATNVGGLLELVEHGVSGYIIPQKNPAALADAIFSLYCHPKERARLGVGARERIRTHFNVARTVNEHRALFEELTGPDLRTDL
ncbi:MAG: glycosyltransferase family 4 protein [Deltaproteobacteria bacterium]|nr:glycosyltransferase family 4 protein [Deltaproteobacteria bacterium]